jgi:hypothetical protein
MSEINFNSEALNEWVELCNEETRMKNEGASQEELSIMRVRVTMGMVALLPNLNDEQKAAFIISLIRNQDQGMDQSVSDEQTDPIHTNDPEMPTNIDDDVTEEK